MAFKMTPGIKSPKMKAGNGLPSNMMMKPCGGPMMTPSKGTPLNAEGDEKKVKYQNNPLIKEGYNTFEKDAAQLASSPYQPYFDKDSKKIKGASNSYATRRANSRMESYKERGGKKTTRSKASLEGEAAMNANTKKRKSEIATTAKLNSKENLKARSKGEASRDADDKARRNKTGIYASKTPKVTKTRKKVEALKPIKAKGIKDVVKRKVAISGGSMGPSASKTKSTKKKDVKITKAPKLAARRVSEPKKEVKSTRLSKRTEKTRAKGEAALASGDKQKALRLRRRVDRQEARSAKREVRGAKREAKKKINNKASGPMMHKGDGKKHAKIQETPEMRAKYVKSLIAKGYEPVKGKPNQFRRGTGNGVLTIGEFVGKPNNDSPAEEIRKAMKAGDAKRKKENKKIKK